MSRADATNEHMGLTSWTDAPLGKIQKFDVVVAKNYLAEDELAQLSRLVNAYLDVAESMALRKIPMTMQDWKTRLNRFLVATDREVLQDAGKVTAEIGKAHAESHRHRSRARGAGRSPPMSEASKTPEPLVCIDGFCQYSLCSSV